jgi:nucleotide-binding universal stress UspA family protein
MKTVIVGLDGSELSERALVAAAALAARSDATIHLLTCPWEGVAVDPQRYLEDHARTLEPVAVTTEVSDRHPAEAILAAVGAADEPTVCMATHGRGWVGKVVLGSVATRVVREATAPVLLVGPSYERRDLHRRKGPVVAGSDGSDTALAMLSVAAPWAATMGAGLRIVEVVGPEEMVVPEGCDDETAEALDRLAAAAARVGSAAAEPDVEVLYGHDPAASIVSCAQDLDAPVIAVGTHGTSGVDRRAAMGSVTTSLVHTSPLPVLVVGPRNP